MKKTTNKSFDKKKIRKVSEGRGCINIYSTFNNTILNISKTNGEVLWQASSGSSGFRGAKKSTAYAAQKVAESAIEKAVEFGIFNVMIKARGIGSGRDAAIRKFFGTRSLKIEELVDMTGIPHNGCRPPKKPRK
jgi:small subunit ribosomal protein S11